VDPDAPILLYICGEAPCGGMPRRLLHGKLQLHCGMERTAVRGCFTLSLQCGSALEVPPSAGSQSQSAS